MTLSKASHWFLAGLDWLVMLLSKTGLSPSFIRFGMVGAAGFCWDTATVYALRGVAGLYVAGTAGFAVAATANWGVNRVWTYRHQTHDEPHKQWMRFMIANFIGFLVNRGAFFTLITVNETCHSHPVLAIIAGSAGGIGFNYLLSKRFVFR